MEFDTLTKNRKSIQDYLVLEDLSFLKILQKNVMDKFLGSYSLVSQIALIVLGGYFTDDSFLVSSLLALLNFHS